MRPPKDGPTLDSLLGKVHGQVIGPGRVFLVAALALGVFAAVVIHEYHLVA